MAEYALPDWLLNIISAKTGVNYGGGFKPLARLGKCGRCRVSVLKGLDNDMMAANAIADPIVLTQEGVAWALLARRVTYRLYGTMPSQFRLVYRDEWETRHGWNPARRVVAQHICNVPVPLSYARDARQR
jgi:hypothetical protein